MKNSHFMIAAGLALVLGACSQNPFGKSDQGIENPPEQGAPAPTKESNPESPANPDNPGSEQPPVAEAGPNFQIMQAQIFNQNTCTRCHADFKTYDGVVRSLSTIESAIRNDRMPPGRPLRQDLKDLLIKWIQLGAPQ